MWTFTRTFFLRKSGRPLIILFIYNILHIAGSGEHTGGKELARKPPVAVLVTNFIKYQKD